MNVGFSGSRELRKKDHALLTSVLKEIREKYGSSMKVHVGDCRGVDDFVRSHFAQEGTEVSIYKADWDVYGKSAGPIRNKKIVENSDVLYAFPRSNSRGTQSAMSEARRKGIDVVVKHLDD